MLVTYMLSSLARLSAMCVGGLFSTKGVFVAVEKFVAKCKCAGSDEIWEGFKKASRVEKELVSVN